MIILLILLITALVAAYLLFVTFYPSFGGDVTKERQLQYATSLQFENGKFVNTNRVNMDLGLSETLSLARKFFFTKVKNGRPKQDIQVSKIDSSAIANYNSPTRFVWFGKLLMLLVCVG